MTGRPPPTDAAEHARSPAVGIARRLVSGHAIGQWHLIPIVTGGSTIIVTPRLVLVPRINLPFVRLSRVVVNVVVIEETIPILDAHVHGVVTGALLDIE